MKDIQTASTPQVGNDFNPLSGKVNEKSYAGGGAGTAPVVDIAEPVFVPPNLNTQEPPKREEPGSKKTAGSSSAQSAQPSGFNQELNELNDSEKMKAAQQAAQFGMTLYKGAHTWANANLVQISDRRINKLMQEGEIDLDVPVPYSQHGMVRLGEFIQEFNVQSGEVLVVEKEFEDAVMPPLTRVLAKHGAGMTDENYLMFMFGQDIITKAIKVAQLRGTVKDIISFAKEQTATNRLRPMAPVVPMQAVVDQPVEVGVTASAGGAPVHHEPTTLQERALASVRVNAAGDGVILPDVKGSAEQTKAMVELLEKDSKDLLKKRKVRQTLANGGAPRPRRRKAGVPQPGAKKGVGRPTGSKNKPK